MVTLGIDGLASGLDTTSIITNLMKVEAKPQDLLRTQLSAAQAKATAYRAVNTRFDAVRTAAEALTAGNLAAARTATSSSTTAIGHRHRAAAVRGPRQLPGRADRGRQAGAHRPNRWTSATAPVCDQPEAGLAHQGARQHAGSWWARISCPADATLTDAMAAINGTGYGVNATIIQVGRTEFRLQVTGEGPDRGRRAHPAAGTTGRRPPPERLRRSWPDPGPRRRSRPDGIGGRCNSSTNTFQDLITGDVGHRLGGGPYGDAVDRRVGSRRQRPDRQGQGPRRRRQRRPRASSRATRSPPPAPPPRPCRATAHWCSCPASC